MLLKKITLGLRYEKLLLINGIVVSCYIRSEAKVDNYAARMTINQVR